MARKKNQLDVLTEHPEMPEPAASRMVVLQNDAAEQYDRAVALAGELGYQGAVTVDALEGEIRFYQRRTVEAILETGKRLLVLKELTAHGEFIEKVEALGFARTTAFRFMQAAGKTAKCSKLEHLSAHMKSAAAFLELVTHDDDADLEQLAQLDDIDRLSASEVRGKLRELQAEREATQKLLDGKNQQLDKLTADLERERYGKLPPDETRQKLSERLAGAALGAQQAVAEQLKTAIAKLLAHGAEHGGNDGRDGGTALAAGCVMQVQQALNDVRDEFALPAFQDYVPNWLELKGTDGGEAIDRETAIANGDVWLADIAGDPADFETKE